jgi:phage terminase Nu1 subunit (DNA packaging protein)
MDIPTHPEARLSVDQVAYLLGVDSRTVKRWERTGKILEPTKINGRKSWRYASIIEWIREWEIQRAAEKKSRGTIDTQGVTKRAAAKKDGTKDPQVD